MTHEIESDPPPPPGLKEARFGGERGKTERKPLSPLVNAVAVPTWQALGPLNLTDPGQTTAYEPSQAVQNCNWHRHKNANPILDHL